MRTINLLLLLTIAATPAPAQTPGQQPADTVPPPAVTERAHTFPSDDLVLAGTIATPATGNAPWPVVVMVAAAGPIDRNGNTATGNLRTNLYAQLAWRLAEQGIASLRYDKRVLPSTQGRVRPERLRIDDLARDVAAAVQSVRDDDRFSSVVLLGHGEGTTLAVRAVRSGAEVDGLVLAAGAGRPLLTLLRDQLGRQVDERTLEIYDRAMDLYLLGDSLTDLPDALRPLFLPVNREYIRSMMAISPIEELSQTSVPVLIVQGDRDIQMRTRDARALHAARPDGQLLIIPGANHMFKAVADTTLAAQLPTYTDPTVPVVREVVDAVVEFVRGVSGG